VACYPNQAQGTVRLLILGVLFISFASNAVAECPVLPRRAPVDLPGALLEPQVLRIPVRAVEFILIRPQVGQNEPPVIAHYAARQTLRPNSKKTAFSVLVDPRGASNQSRNLWRAVDEFEAVKAPCFNYIQ